VLDNSRGIHPKLPRVPRTKIIDVLADRRQTIKAPNGWPVAKRANEHKILRTIVSQKLQDLQLTYKALLSGGLVVVNR
jgi:hypothetical protein